MLNYFILQPQQVQAVFEKVKDFVPDRYRSLEQFVQLYFRKDTMFFEIGDFYGAFWLADIIPGWRATVHVVCWDNESKDQSLRARAILKELCRLFRFRKLTAYIPTHLEAAARFAEKIGFVTEGVEKLAEYYDGRLVDYLLTAFYKED